MKIVAAVRAKDADDATAPLRELSAAELDRRIEELAKSAGYEIRRPALPRPDGAAGDDGPGVH